MIPHKWISRGATHVRNPCIRRVVFRIRFRIAFAAVDARRLLWESLRLTRHPAKNFTFAVDVAR